MVLYDYEITILGCGSSTGVPVVNCNCTVCSTKKCKNIRLRTSALIKYNNTTFLIDTTPDLRLQALNNHLTHIDFVIYTHAHADHLHGIEDLCLLTNDQQFDIYGSQETLTEIKQRFPYLFLSNVQQMNRCLIGNVLTYYQKYAINNIEIIIAPQCHNTITSSSILINSTIAYCTDFKSLPRETLELLSSCNLDVLIIECLRYSDYLSDAHMTFNETLHYITKINPQRAVLTHMSHCIDYDDIVQKLTRYQQIHSLNIDVVPAYDGLKITKI